jgi:hypothetical protein
MGEMKRCYPAIVTDANACPNVNVDLQKSP